MRMAGAAINDFCRPQHAITYLSDYYCYCVSLLEFVEECWDDHVGCWYGEFFHYFMFHI